MKKAIISIIIAILFSSVALSIQAQEASLFLFPGSGSFKIGDTFSVELKTDTGGIPINAAQTTIYFPPDKLEVLNISKESSVFTFWPEEPSFSNSSGKVSFSGGVPHPGFTGIGNIITINFKTKNEGFSLLALGEGRVLADDGKGTDALVFIKEAKYSVQKETILPEAKPEVPPTKIPLPPEISSLTHSQEEEWYNNNNPQFQWKLTPDIIGVSFVLDHQSDTVPDQVSEGKFESKVYEEIDDGIWYFHLRLENEIGWSEPSHRKIQIDTQPPYPFKVIIDNAGDLTNPNPKLYFETKDDTSGINHYKLKIGETDFSDLMLAQVNPFSPPFQSPGQHPVVVRAVDGAGNIVEAKAVLDVEPIASPQITLSPAKYIAGEETLYLEGTALPEVEIIIFLKENGKEVKIWSTSSNMQGEWSFSTKELIKSGLYYLSALAKDKRGVESKSSDSYKIEVSLSGVSFGPFMIAFRELAIFLILFLFFGIIIAGYFTFRTRRAKKILRKETREVEETLNQVFNTLRAEIEERISMFDSRPGFNEQEKKIYDELKEALKTAEESVEKEIKDVEKELERK
jgi:gas vesicle protein